VKEIEAQDLCTNAALMGEKLIARLNGAKAKERRGLLGV
jgi:4-aminobutyrate aminotransferase-like enzyme